MSQLKADPSTAHIPVVVISADATARQVGRLLKDGAVSYLTKPLDVAEFFTVLDQVVLRCNTAKSLSSEPALTEVDSIR